MKKFISFILIFTFGFINSSSNMKSPQILENNKLDGIKAINECFNIILNCQK